MKLTMVAAIVVYNKKVKDSITCKNILNINDKQIEILIIDNSTQDYKNKTFCEKKILSIFR